jgi:hypothetical protein
VNGDQASDVEAILEAAVVFDRPRRSQATECLQASVLVLAQPVLGFGGDLWVNEKPLAVARVLGPPRRGHLSR